jgi:peptide/nickel transport system substrate-binding protein
MKRRNFIASSAATLAPPAVGAALAAPRIAAAQDSRVLKYIPQADVNILDPVFSNSYIPRDHGYMVFDTLFGMDGGFNPSPQMAEGLTTEDDGRLVKIVLRAGLTFHDGTPVLARDAAASIRRWGVRDGFGQTLMEYTDELSAPSDRVIQFRLKRPFPMLAMALGKPFSFCPIMPERLAKTDAFTQVTEMVGSGPYRFNARERVIGSLLVYEKFANYSPTPVGKPDWTAGPKIVHFDRVEWHVVPDAGTAAAAIQSGQLDWWGYPSNDVLPVLNRAGVTVDTIEPTGYMGCMRFNHLQPPFNNPEIRRIVLQAISQEDFMIAVAGDDPRMRVVPAGVFTPGTPMANDAGFEALTSTRDFPALKRQLAAAGYNGEKCVVLAAADNPQLKALNDVGADLLGRLGMNVDYPAIDFGTFIARRARKDPPEHGGWSVLHGYWGGFDLSNPAAHYFMRGQGEKGVFGWPTSPRLEELRLAWIDAPDLAAQKKIAVELQKQAFIDLPYAPLGSWRGATAYNKSLTGVPRGFPCCWGVRRV